MCDYDNVIISIPPGPFKPTWDSLENYVVPEWYEDAKWNIPKQSVESWVELIIPSL